MQSRAEIRCLTPVEDHVEDVVVDLFFMARARKREWRRFESPRLRLPDLLCTSLIEALDAGKGLEVQGRDRNFDRDWQKKNSGGQISYSRTSIGATRLRGASSELVETNCDGGTVPATLELVVA
ncbi:hypothetical protein TIFTF001_002451 [Ficus carica]|uniref:Uncharacterized protein n=1 Tax=Ficus carica TaxID=3494 RepID=A0AA87Z4F9_FICCA|nr:hypothetical protein TIFTF001_002451 [Ficus carica]